MQNRKGLAIRGVHKGARPCNGMVERRCPSQDMQQGNLGWKQTRSTDEVGRLSKLVQEIKLHVCTEILYYYIKE
jgi:hypothetical protein